MTLIEKYSEQIVTSPETVNRHRMLDSDPGGK
jgi:hypothetical protein